MIPLPRPDMAGAPTIHATAIVVAEAGVLIRGRSGAGKSALALALIAAAARAQCFARLVADDRVVLTAVNGRLVARAPEIIAGMIERRGCGIEHVAYEPCTVVRLVVDLAPTAQCPRLPEPQDEAIELEGVPVARMMAAERSCDATAAAVLARLAPLGAPSTDRA